MPLTNRSLVEVRPDTSRSPLISTLSENVDRPDTLSTPLTLTSPSSVKPTVILSWICSLVATANSMKLLSANS